MEKIIEEYKLVVDDVPVTVKIIVKKGSKLSYSISLPVLSKPTLALLDDIRRKLITEVNISASEIFDPKIIHNLKEKFRTSASSLITEVMPNIDKTTNNLLVGRLLHKMVGLGDIEFLLNDDNLEEIVVNTSEEPIYVYHKKYGWLETNITIAKEEDIQNYANIIARRIGRQITTLNPLLDAHLVTGDRSNAVLYPVSTKGNTITIRKFARDPWTIADLVENNTCSSEIFALIWTAIQYEMNILVSGGTASGKTTFLNVIMPFMPPNHRIISIEDTRELMLPKFLYWCPLVTREPNPEGKGQVSMLDLLVNSLRMRPDRIILGEMRKKDQAEVLFEAMHTGHSVYATVHADTIGETIQRLTNPPILVPPNLLSAVDLNIVMFRDRRRGIRRIYQVGEFIPAEEQGKTTIRPNILYRWDPIKDKTITHSSSLRFFEKLSRNTGLTQREMNDELDMRKKIIDWIVKQKIRKLEEVGRVMHEYYTDKESLLKLVNKNSKPDSLLKNV